MCVGTYVCSRVQATMYCVCGPNGNSVRHSSGSICFIWHSLSLTLELVDPAGLLGQQFPAAYFCFPSSEVLSLGMQVTHNWLFPMGAGIELRSWCLHGKCLTNMAISLVLNHNSQLNLMGYSFFQTLETWSDSFSHLGHHWPDSLCSPDCSRQRVFGSSFLPCGKPAQQDRETPPLHIIGVVHEEAETSSDISMKAPHRIKTGLCLSVAFVSGGASSLCWLCILSSVHTPLCLKDVKPVHSTGHGPGWVCRAFVVVFVEHAPRPKALKDFLAPVGKEPKFPSALLLPQRIKAISSRKPGLFSVCSLYLFFSVNGLRNFSSQL